jgi:hypothetical protein
MSPRATTPLAPAERFEPAPIPGDERRHRKDDLS